MSMARLCYLIFAFCVWISIANSQETFSSGYNETDPNTDPQDTADIKYSYPTKVIFTSALLFTFLVSVIGNSLVIYVITKHRSMRTSTNRLIMNLAVCDLLITVLQTPTFIAALHTEDTWFGGTVENVTCKIIAYADSLLLYCSVFNLVSIAIDRFLAVTRPLTYKLSSKWVVKIGIPVVWLMSALLSINTVLITKIVHDRTPKCITSEDSYQEHYISTPCFIVSLLVLIVLYSIIAYHLWRRKIPGEVSNNQHALAIRTARKVTFLMISVVIVFFVSWAPSFALVFLNFIDSTFVSDILILKYPFLFAVSYWLILNSSACNPYLYFIFIESFRQSLKSACFRCRAPELRQERRIETEQPMNKRQTLNNFTRKERAIELTAYSTVNHRDTLLSIQGHTQTSELGS